jgi:hypothetical protein
MPGRRTYGHSLIVDPWGEVLADAGEGVGIVSARIEVDAIAKARRMVPSLQHDRVFHSRSLQSALSRRNSIRLGLAARALCPPALAGHDAAAR